MASRRDEEIRAATVGEPARVDGPIHLAESDPAWPSLFEHEAGRIRSILRDRVLRLEHVGSTSVPGLAAKPIIDIVLAVPDSADEGAYLPALEAGGYILRIREPGWFEHRMLKGPDADINLHVFGVGCPEIDRMVAFRDRLRSDDQETAPVRGRQAGARRPRLDLCPALRRREEPGDRGDPGGGGQGTRRGIPVTHGQRAGIRVTALAR